MMKLLSFSGWFAFGLLLLHHFQIVDFINRSSSHLKLATSFSDAADRCLIDVRDKHLNFEKSSNCNSLKQRSLFFISVGGAEPNDFSEANFLYIGGLKTAWSAVALDNANGNAKRIQLW